MAFVEKYTRTYEAGETVVRWRARYRDPTGKERSRTFKRRVDAERYLTQIESQVLMGTWADPSLGRTTIGEWAPRWLAGKRSLKPKTRASYESLLRSRVLPTFADHPLARLERRDVEEWVGAMERAELSASRIRQAFNVLASLLDAAIANGMLTRNVARGVELPRVQSAPRRFLSTAEVARLVETIHPGYRVLVLVLAYSGIRWGEAVALRRHACDLLRRQLRILESATEVNGHLSWGLPKTHRQRAVSIPRFVADEVAARLASEVPTEPDALVFTAEGFGPLRHHDFIRYRWRPAVKNAGLPAGLTPHELRHTAASLLIASGAGPKSVQVQLGHSTITTTFDVYGHLFEGHLDEVMDRLDIEWRQASA